VIFRPLKAVPSGETHHLRRAFRIGEHLKLDWADAGKGSRSATFSFILVCWPLIVEAGHA
jgi:hypothetical protein